MAKKPVDAPKAETPKTPAKILTQLRKNARATMRGLTALDENDALDSRWFPWLQLPCLFCKPLPG